MKTAEEIFEQAISELGFYNHKPSEMSNSDLWMCTCHAMKLYANQKLDEAANNMNWDNCYEGGDYCKRNAHEQSIFSLKDEI